MPATRVRSVEGIHSHLRSAIIDGHYHPGAVLSQVQLARELGVSRTPLREAMRRLEAEGLIEARPNQRPRVARVGAESLDVEFTDRVLLESTGIAVTVPLLKEVELHGLLVTTTALRVARERRDTAAQAKARRSLHQAFVSHAGPRLRATILDQFDAFERHRRAHVELPPDVADRYIAIAGACTARDGRHAARLVARFEVELAHAVLHRVDPSYTPVAVTTALRMIDGPGAEA
ncbi:MAG: GntR family transcriptional regulator [Vulcanimicrobiaceae bacterium]